MHLLTLISPIYLCDFSASVPGIDFCSVVTYLLAYLLIYMM